MDIRRLRSAIKYQHIPHFRPTRKASPEFESQSTETPGDRKYEELGFINKPVLRTYSDRSSIQATRKHGLRTLTSYKGLLWLFVLAVTLCIGTLILLQQLDQKHFGYGSGPMSTKIQYLIRFGPTAIFIIIVACWGKADYMIRIDAPWKQMSNGYAKARKTVLLDYISPKPTNLIEAFRNRHWEVVAAVVIFVSLKLSVFFSTGLLNYQTVVIPGQIDNLQLEKGENSFFNTTQINMKIAARSYVAATQGNQSWPIGTSSAAAFQAISPNNKVPYSAHVTADVSAVYPDLECETANSTFHVEVLSNSTEDSTGSSWLLYHMNWTSKNTGGSRKLISDAFCSTTQNRTCPTKQVTYYLSPIAWDFADLDYSASNSRGIVLSVFELSTRSSPSAVPLVKPETASYNTTEISGHGWIQSMKWMSTLVCRTNYSVETGQLESTWFGTQTGWINKRLSKDSAANSRLLENYSFTNLTNDVVSVAAQADNYVVKMSNSPDNSRYGFFEMMLYSMKANDPSVFKDPNKMVKPANIVFKGLASVWIGSWVSFPDHASTNATYTLDANRLRISYVGFWPLFGLLSLVLLCLSGLLISGRGHASFHHNNRCVQDASILNSHRKELALLDGTGAFTEKDLQERLGPHSFCTIKESFDGRIALIPERIGGTENIQNISTCVKKSQWRPLATRPWYVLMVVLITLLVVIGLELVQRKSDQNPQSMSLRMSREQAQDITSLSVASIMLGLSLLYSNVGFVAAGISPYLLLSKSPTPLHQVRSDPLQKLPIVAMITRIRSRQYGIASILVAALLGSILLITGSSLYDVSFDTKAYNTTVRTMDAFYLKAALSPDGKGAIAFTLLKHRNAAYVPGTYDEVAYPTFKLNTSDPLVAAIAANPTLASRVVIRAPVLRASLNCTKIESSNITVEAKKNKYANITSVGDLSPNCDYFDQTATQDYKMKYFVTGRLGMTKPLQDNNAITGAESNIVVGPKQWDASKLLAKNRTNADELTTMNTTSSTQLHPYCPSAAFTIGSLKLNSSDASKVSRIVCSQYLEEIPATLRFDVMKSEMVLEKKHPPVLHEHEARVISQLNWNFTYIFGYRRKSANIDSSNPKTMMDNFYDAVANGIDGVPIESMVGSKNYKQFLKATHHTYRQYMAQVIGNDMRIDRNKSMEANPSTPLGTQLIATIADANYARVVQNRTTKIVLQSVLAAMIVLLLLGSRDLVACGKILTHSPFSVAGRMSLMANSKFVDIIDSTRSESEIMQELGKLELRLGWWWHPDKPEVISRNVSFKHETFDFHITEVSDNAPVGEHDSRAFLIKRKPVPSVSDVSTIFDISRSQSGSSKISGVSGGDHEPQQLGGHYRFGIDIANDASFVQ